MLCGARLTGPSYHSLPRVCRGGAIFSSLIWWWGFSEICQTFGIRFDLKKIISWTFFVSWIIINFLLNFLRFIYKKNWISTWMFLDFFLKCLELVSISYWNLLNVFLQFLEFLPDLRFPYFFGYSGKITFVWVTCRRLEGRSQAGPNGRQLKVRAWNS